MFATGKEGSDLQARIYSKKLKVPKLIDMINEWEKEYEEHNQFKKGLRYFVFNSTKTRDRVMDMGGDLRDYTEFPFESGKTFKNIFFPEKEELIKKVEFFNENESWYNDHGIPYMLGLLLHGEPGCGKTSTIKALANMTQRHIISLPLKNLKNTADLYRALYGEKVNRTVVPMKQRLYVLEDIDCAGLDDIMKKRSQKNSKSQLSVSSGSSESSGSDGPTPMGFPPGFPIPGSKYKPFKENKVTLLIPFKHEWTFSFRF